MLVFRDDYSERLFLTLQFGEQNNKRTESPDFWLVDENHFLADFKFSLMWENLLCSPFLLSIHGVCGPNDQSCYLVHKSQLNQILFFCSAQL